MAESPRSRRGQRLLHVGAALAAPALVLSGIVISMGSDPAPDPSGTGAVSAAGDDAGVAVPVRSKASSAPARPGRPSGIVVPALGVRAPVLPIATEDGALNPPSDPASVGWWAGGALPGSRVGAAVITGHTVHTGGGAFDDLEQLQRGDEVVVLAGGRQQHYAVESVQVLSRAQLASHNVEVFGRGGPGRLVLITCEDWDGTAYRSNVVVTATPAA